MKFRGFDQFAEQAERQLREQLRKVRDEVEAEVMNKVVLPLAQATAPVGSKATGDRKPGRLKQSLKRIQQGGVEKVVSDAPHGKIIDRGRKRGVTPRGQKRVRAKAGQKLRPNKGAPMMGSPKAPRGVSKPVLEEARKRLPEIIDRAVAKAEGRS